MNWAMWIQLITQVGLPLAEKLWQKWSANNEPTQADWDELRALSVQTPESQLRDSLVRAGIPLDSDKAKKLFELLKA